VPCAGAISDCQLCIIEFTVLPLPDLKLRCLLGLSRYVSHIIGNKGSLLGPTGGFQDFLHGSIAIKGSLGR